ncbi:MAG: DUF4352 domain-containing protein [Caldilineaceae bacterium]|nr:DUF4352 domain-containing protein [Caldilineaceae bacterium]
MPRPPVRSMQSRIILFVAIIGLAMILAALFFAFFPETEGETLTGRDLRATADALDERATEVAGAATRLFAGVSSHDSQTPAAPRPVSTRTSSGNNSRTAPVPLGQPWSTPDGLIIRVLGVNFDAWEIVLAENQFNDPPGEGMRMVLAEVEVTNASGDVATPRQIDDSDYLVVGDRGVIYTTYATETRCGVIPKELDRELFDGATVSGSVCVIAPQDEDDFRLIYKPGYQWDEEVVYFALEE